MKYYLRRKEKGLTSIKPTDDDNPRVEVYTSLGDLVGDGYNYEITIKDEDVQDYVLGTDYLIEDGLIAKDSKQCWILDEVDCDMLETHLTLDELEDYLNKSLKGENTELIEEFREELELYSLEKVYVSNNKLYILSATTVPNGMLCKADTVNLLKIALKLKESGRESTNIENAIKYNLYVGKIISCESPTSVITGEVQNYVNTKYIKNLWNDIEYLFNNDGTVYSMSDIEDIITNRIIDEYDIIDILDCLRDTLNNINSVGEFKRLYKGIITHESYLIFSAIQSTELLKESVEVLSNNLEDIMSIDTKYLKPITGLLGYIAMYKSLSLIRDPEIIDLLCKNEKISNRFKYTGTLYRGLENKYYEDNHYYSWTNDRVVAESFSKGTLLRKEGTGIVLNNISESIILSDIFPEFNEILTTYRTEEDILSEMTNFCVLNETKKY